MKQIVFFIFCAYIIAGCKKESQSEKKLEAITITKQPTKKIYHINDKFDATDMVVTATYSNNSNEPLTVTPAMLGYDFTTAGTSKTVIITYQTKTATITGITVNAAEITPEVTGFTPIEAGYGATVTITGSHFSTRPASNSVSFNNIAAVVVSATATELKVTVPKNLQCSGLLRITLAGNTVVSANTFTYLPSYTVNTLAGSSPGFADGQGSAAQFSAPCGVAVDASGNVYVADQGNHRIRKITAAGMASTFAGIGDVNYFADGAAGSATFRYPYGIALSASGTLYVTSADQRVRKISGGIVSTLAGDGTQGFGDGPGNAAKFWAPGYLAVDAAENVYVPDMGNQRIRKVTPGGDVSTFAGSTQGFADGTGTAALFYFPISVVVDAAENLYVADNANNCIRKITPGGVVTTLAGSSSGAAGFADGAGSAAKFTAPDGLVADAAGNFYVADRGNNRIRKITPAGVVSTVAGDGTAGFTDGVASVAQFNHPTGIALDAPGSLYVSDQSNNRIRKITAE